jgi:hypothetical protein
MAVAPTKQAMQRPQGRKGPEWHVDLLELCSASHVRQGMPESAAGKGLAGTSERADAVLAKHCGHTNGVLALPRSGHLAACSRMCQHPAQAQEAAVRAPSRFAMEVFSPRRESCRELASLLHPDRETDPRERKAKNALMQRVNQAYAANDLLTLQELQLQVEQIDLGHIAKASNERLKHCDRVLSEQLQELKHELARVEAGVRFDFNLDPGWGEDWIRASWASRWMAMPDGCAPSCSGSSATCSCWRTWLRPSAGSSASSRCCARLISVSGFSDQRGGQSVVAG